MGDWYDRYKHRVQLNGITSQERIINQKKRDFDKYLKNTPNRFEVNIDDNMTNKYLISLQDVTLNNKYGDEKYVVTYNETPMKIGSVFGCLENTWLVVEKEHNVIQDHQTFKVRPCNHILKWMDSNGTPQQCPCIVQNQTLYTTGITPVKYEDEGNAKESIILPSNENTLNVKRDKRLIINNNFWRITNINKDTEGIINLICSESKYNSATDNLELGIADYYNNIHTYKLEINTTPITLNINETLHLDIKAYDNDVIVENPQINYSILNADILQIENNTIKPLKIGTTKLNIQFKNITKEIEINIVDVVNDNYDMLINGSNYIKWGRQAEYDIILKLNNVTYNDVCDFYLTDINNNSTTLATIISKENNKCVIEANTNKKSGVILLHCKTDNIHEIKEIEIKSLWV